MADLVNVGTRANDGTGDTLRAAMQKLNAVSLPADAKLIEIVGDGGPPDITTVYDDTGVPTTGTVLWSDGSAGIWTRITKNETFNDYDAFTVTHTNSGKTVTQAAVTRDSTGRITATPALTVS